jgi:ABC-type sugar transport system substrate-binding protein
MQLLRSSAIGPAVAALLYCGWGAAPGLADSAAPVQIADAAIHSPLTENDVVVGAAKDALIQVIQPGVHPYPAAGNEGLKEEAKTLGLTNLQITQSNWDPAAEVANIQNAITKGAKAIIIQAVSSEGVVPSIEAANKRGICTVAVITGPGSKQGVVYPGMKGYVGWNEFEGGRIAGEALAKALNGKGNVVVIQGQLESAASKARQAGAEAIWKEKYPGIKVLAARPADYDATKARQVMQDFIQRYGTKINGVLSITNNMGTAAADAMTGTPLEKKTPIVSYGGQKEFINYIRDGRAYGTTPFAPKSEAAEALDLAVACINGDRAPVFFSETELPPVKALKAHNYMIDPTSVNDFQPQW